jgi:hypothetical protein
MTLPHTPVPFFALVTDIPKISRAIEDSPTTANIVVLALIILGILLFALILKFWSLHYSGEVSTGSKKKKVVLAVKTKPNPVQKKAAKSAKKSVKKKGKSRPN